MMNATFALAMLVSMAAGEQPQNQFFDSYTKGYKAAQSADKPMLVILQPTAEEDASAVSRDLLEKSRQRRELLGKYVVVAVNTTTEHGKKVDALFGANGTPRVVIIDRDQQWQIYQSGQLPADGTEWTDLLTHYQHGQHVQHVSVQQPVQYQSYQQPSYQQQSYQQPYQYYQNPYAYQPYAAGGCPNCR